MENKSLWQIIKGSFTGSDNEGSAKRMASFYFTAVLITAMVGVYLYCYYLAVNAAAPTTTQTIVVNSFEWTFGAMLLTVWVFFGFTSGDKLMDLFRFMRGGNNPPAKEEKAE